MPKQKSRIASCSLGAMVMPTVAAAACVTLHLFHPGPATALTCGITASMPTNSADLAIAGGWPDDPYDLVVIGTVLGVEAERGDAGTFGETLTVQLDAVLVGSTPGRTIGVFNPPLGSAGWIGFEVDGQYLIAAYKDPEHGFSTSLCTPNQPVETRERFDHLVSVAEDPLIPDTAAALAAPEIAASPATILGTLLTLVTLTTMLRALSRSDQASPPGGSNRRD